MRTQQATEFVRTHAGRFWAYLRTLRVRELVLLLTLLGLAGGVWGFSEIADEVGEGETQKFDKLVMSAMREGGGLAEPRGPAWLANAARDVTALGSNSVLLLVVLSVLGYLCMQRSWRAAVFVVTSTIGGALVVHLMKNIFERERPSLFEHLDQVSTYSFPSGHAMLSAVVYITLGALLSRLVARRGVKIYFLGVALLLAFLVGLSRVYVGVHYPTDVLAGWAAGLAWAALCWLVAAYVQWQSAEWKVQS